MGVKYSKEDFKFSLKSLLPKGKIWVFSEDSEFLKLLHSFADELLRVSDRANYLLEEADPRVTVELITDYESYLDIPGDCAQVLADTTELRRADIVAALTSSGGATTQYLLDIARDKGFNIDLVEQKVGRCGLLKSGDPCNGNLEWAYVLRLNAEETDAQNPRLLCLLNKLKPAHIFLFTSFQNYYARSGIMRSGDRIREIVV